MCAAIFPSRFTIFVSPARSRRVNSGTVDLISRSGQDSLAAPGAVHGALPDQGSETATGARRNADGPPLGSMR